MIYPIHDQYGARIGTVMTEEGNPPQERWVAYTLARGTKSFCKLGCGAAMGRRNGTSQPVRERFPHSLTSLPFALFVVLATLFHFACKIMVLCLAGTGQSMTDIYNRINPYAQKRVIVFDTETTGILPYDRIITLGAVKIEGGELLTQSLLSDFRSAQG